MQKLLAKWWVRILIFLISIIVVPTTINLLGFDKLMSMTLVIVLLTVISISILAFRAGSNYKTFGLQFDKSAVYDFIKGFIIVLCLNLIFILFGFIFGYNLEIHKNFYAFNFELILYNISYLFVMAYFEEIMFRGVIFQSLRERFGDVISIIVLNILFCIVHYSNPNISTMGLINIIIAGIFFAVLYITTESLWLPISVHFFWNLNQQVLLGSNISGINFEIQLFNLTAINSSSSWLFGGGFGIEEGVLTMFLLTILSFISFKINKQNPYILATKFRMKYEESRILVK